MAETKELNVKELPEHQAFRAAERKLAGLMDERDRLKREQQAVEAEMRDLKGTEPVLKSAARAFLAGATPEQAPQHSNVAKLGKLRDSHQLHAEAVNLQREELVRTQTLYSIAACDAARPAYAVLLARIAQQLSSLADLAREEVAFRDRLEGQNVDAAMLPVMPLRFIWRADEETVAVRYVKELIERKFLTGKEPWVRSLLGTGK